MFIWNCKHNKVRDEDPQRCLKLLAILISLSPYYWVLGCYNISNNLIIIICLLMSWLLWHRLPYQSHIRRTDYNPTGSSAVWWVLMIANAASTNGLTRLLEQFELIDPMIDQSCLTFAITRWEHWPRGQ
jgi:hypothetical protein